MDRIPPILPRVEKLERSVLLIKLGFKALATIAVLGIIYLMAK